MHAAPRRVTLHIRPITEQDAPIVVAKAALRLTSAGKPGRCAMLTKSGSALPRAKELLEAIYRDDPELPRARAVNAAAIALANQMEQFSPS